MVGAQWVPQAQEGQPLEEEPAQRCARVVEDRQEGNRVLEGAWAEDQWGGLGQDLEGKEEQHQVVDRREGKAV